MSVNKQRSHFYETQVILQDQTVIFLYHFTLYKSKLNDSFG